jgi:hypothetical protein
MMLKPQQSKAHANTTLPDSGSNDHCLKSGWSGSMSSTKGTLSAEAEEVDEVSCDDCCEIISEAARSSEVTKE